MRNNKKAILLKTKIRILWVFVATLIIVIISLGVLIFSLQNTIFDLETNKTEAFYTPLNTWEENPKWSIEHLWYGNSHFVVGRINNERYVLNYDNWKVNESFSLTFDFDGACKIELFNNSCESFGEEGCHNTYEIKGKVTEGWLKY